MSRRSARQNDLEAAFMEGNVLIERNTAARAAFVAALLALEERGFYVNTKIPSPAVRNLCQACMELALTLQQVSP